MIALFEDPSVPVQAKGRIELQPCPFCAGPPVPIIVDHVKGVTFRDDAIDPEDGLYASAYVFCHECGAQGGSIEDIIFNHQDRDALIRKGIGLWQCRDSRHRELYDGLQLYPRPGKWRG
jgi:hypothetical protein